MKQLNHTKSTEYDQLVKLDDLSQEVLKLFSIEWTS